MVVYDSKARRYLSSACCAALLMPDRPVVNEERNTSDCVAVDRADVAAREEEDAYAEEENVFVLLGVLGTCTEDPLLLPAPCVLFLLMEGGRSVSTRNWLEDERRDAVPG